MGGVAHRPLGTSHGCRPLAQAPIKPLAQAATRSLAQSHTRPPAQAHTRPPAQAHTRPLAQAPGLPRVLSHEDSEPAAGLMVLLPTSAVQTSVHEEVGHPHVLILSDMTEWSLKACANSTEKCVEIKQH